MTDFIHFFEDKISGGILFFLLGSLLGSFANVLIFRIPKGMNFIFISSFCDHCKKKIKWFENIPLLSWIFLRGMCSSCKKKIPLRYLFVELLTGFLFLSLFLHFGLKWILLEYLIFVFGLIVVSFIDFDHMILPDSFTLSGIAIGLTGAIFNSERLFLDALFGCLLGGGSLLIMALFYFAIRKEEGLGGGDVKLLAWIGSLLGWKAIPFVIISSSLIGSIVGLFIALKTKGGLKTMIPFGPYLSLGGILYIFFGFSIGKWYLSLFMLS